MLLTPYGQKTCVFYELLSTYNCSNTYVIFN